MSLNIWACDLATETGFAMGHPPAELSQLNSMAISLRIGKPLDCMVKDNMRLALNLETFLKRMLTFKEAIPDMIVYEAPMDPQAKQQSGHARNSKSMLLPWTLAQKLEEIAFKYEIRCEKVYPITVRNTFLGKANAGQRSKTKTEVLDRCKEWGYLPPHAKNDNQADAIAVWHWAQLYYGKWRPPMEHIMGKMVPVVGAGSSA